MDSVIPGEKQGPRPKRGIAIALLVGAALCWSLGGVFIKSVDWSPMAIAGTRSAIAALVVFACFPRMRITWSMHQLAGAAAYALAMVTFVAATRMTTAANAVLLQYAAPAWVALFSAWFLGERARRSDWLTIFLVMGGMVLFFLDRLTLAGTWGNVWASVSGICFAWVILLLRRQKDTSPYGSVFLGNVLTALVCLPWMFRGAPGPGGWAGLILLGTVQLGLAYVMFSIASRHVTALEASLILLMEPLLNPLWTFLALGEVPGTMAMAGGVIILGAITFRAALPWMRVGRGR